MRLFLVLLVASCAAEPPRLQLIESKSPALAGRLVGVDSDGAGGFWLAINDYLPQGHEYYDPQPLHVLHVDAALAPLAHFSFNDSQAPASGIVFTGDAVWVNHSGGTYNDTRLRKIDPISGAEVASFATESNIADVCARNGRLLLSSIWNEVVAIDPARGGELYRFELPFLPDGGVQRGITSNEEGIWVLDLETDSIHVVDDRGTPMAAFALPTDQDTYADYIDQLAWDGDRLVMTYEGQLHFLEVPR